MGGPMNMKLNLGYPFVLEYTTSTNGYTLED